MRVPTWQISIDWFLALFITFFTENMLLGSSLDRHLYSMFITDVPPAGVTELISVLFADYTLTIRTELKTHSIFL